MTNYKQFYNAWMGFAKPKRELLVEDVGGGEKANVVSEKFLFLTTPKKEYDTVLNFIKTKEPKDVLNTKEPQFDIIRRGLRMIEKNPDIQDFSKLGTQPVELRLQKTKQPNVYQVVGHHGRARNFANIYKNNSDLNIKMPVNIIFTDGKNLDQAFNEGLSIKAQNQVLDSRSEKESIILINQLIPDYSPSGGEDVAIQKLKQDYEVKLSEAINTLVSNPYEKMGKKADGGIERLSVDQKLDVILSAPFTAFKKFIIADKNMEYFKSQGDVQIINPNILQSLRDAFIEQINKQLTAKNDKNQVYKFVNFKSPSGMYFFALRKADTETVTRDTPEEEVEKNKITFIKK